MGQTIELQFWQDIFRMALGNPQFTAYLLRLSKDNHCLLLDYLATFADDSVKALRYRISERKGPMYSEYNPATGIPK